MDTKTVRECLKYDKDLGLMTWRTRPRNHFSSEIAWKTCNSKFSGKVAGNKNSGLYVIGINGKKYLANRLAAIYMGYELLRSDSVICLDGDTYNIKWNNLFVADMRVAAVRREARNKNDNKCIYTKPNGTFEVSIKTNGRLLYGGVFKSIEEARKSRNEIFRLIYGTEP